MRGMLQAALERVRVLESLLQAADARIESRLALIRPCLEAQQRAADAGLPSRSAAQVVPRDVVVLRNVVEHNFGVEVEGLSAADARRLQRGERQVRAGEQDSGGAERSRQL